VLEVLESEEPGPVPSDTDVASPGSHDETGVDADSEATVLSAFSEDEIEKGPNILAPAEPALAISRSTETASLASRLRRLGSRPAPAPLDRDAPLEEQHGISAEPDGTATTPIIEPEPELELEPEELPEDEPTDEPAPADVDSADHGEAMAPSVDAEVGQVLIVIDSDSGSLALEAPVGTTILEAVQASGAERGPQVDWECGDGGCGVCILGVVEGADRMDPPDPATGEMKTIQITEQVAPDPSRYRLACLARVRGAVRLRKLT
jgi:ferredoxin